MIHASSEIQESLFRLGSSNLVEDCMLNVYMPQALSQTFFDQTQKYICVFLFDLIKLKSRFTLVYTNSYKSMMDESLCSVVIL